MGVIDNHIEKLVNDALDSLGLNGLAERLATLEQWVAKYEPTVAQLVQDVEGLKGAASTQIPAAPAS